jgi:hypothetical protein
MSAAASPPFTTVVRRSRARSPGLFATAVPALLVAAASLLAWWLVDPRTPDLAAQVYRAHLYDQAGFTLWDNNWYAGHHVPGYSLLFPPLAHLLGLRLLGVLAVLASTAVFAALMRDRYPAGAAWASAWFALAASGDVWIGRLTFALGVALGLGAILAACRGHRLGSGALAVLCAAASPVAALFVALAALTWALAAGRPLRAAVLGVPAVSAAAAMALLFPEGGRQPFAATSVAATLAAALAFLVLVSPREPVLRVGAVLYLLAVVLSVLVSSPMGSNVARVGVLFAWPLLVAAHTPWRGAIRPRLGLRRAALVVAGPALVLWTVWGPVREAVKVAGDRSVAAAYYVPVRSFLAPRLRPPARVEVPFTRGHWETVLLGDGIPLARGWERQLDTRYDRLFFDGPLTAARYEAWLRSNAVRYVALPDAPLDVSSHGEVALLRHGLPDLRPVFQSAHWRVFVVTDATPLVRGPGALTALRRDGFSVQAHTAGALVVRIHFTRYWRLVAGAGCVSSAPGGWTQLSAAHAGTLEVRAHFSVAAALASGRHCR